MVSDDVEWRSTINAHTMERERALLDFIEYVRVGQGVRVPVLRAAGVPRGTPATVPSEVRQRIVDNLSWLQRTIEEWRRGGEVLPFPHSPARTGALVHALASRQSDEDADVVILLRAFEAANEAPGIAYERARSMLRPPNANVNGLLLFGRWYGASLPVLRLSAPLASALMLTDMPAEMVNDLVAPFSAFRIEIPRDLFPDVEHPGSYWAHLFVTKHVTLGRTVWSFSVESTSGDAFSVNQPRLASFVTAWNPEAESMWGSTPKRLLELCGRLAIGVCAMAGFNERALRRTPGARSMGSLTREPRVALYTLGADVPVDVNLTEVIREYARGAVPTRRALAWPVRGHWRNQAHGRELSLRKRLWIQPFWKGDPSALGLGSRRSPTET